MNNIGEKIYSLRKRKELSQEQLGFELGVSRQTISKWESNSVQPNLENIKSLSELFGVSPGYFFSDTQENVVNSDIAVTVDEIKAHRSKLLISISVIIGVLCLLSMLACIITGNILFTPNTGAYHIKTANVELYLFILLCIAAGSLLVGEVAIFIKILCKKRNVNKS